MRARQAKAGRNMRARQWPAACASQAGKCSVARALPRLHFAEAFRRGLGPIHLLASFNSERGELCFIFLFFIASVSGGAYISVSFFPVGKFVPFSFFFFLLSFLFLFFLHVFPSCFKIIFIFLNIVFHDFYLFFINFLPSFSFLYGFFYEW
jgi:hypothetical protein